MFASPSSPLMSTGALPSADACSEYLAFQLGAETYGVNILGIQEIRTYEQPTRIAGCPSHLRGVLDLRGESVPVVDLRICLGLHAPLDASTFIVVISPDDHQTMGMVVDSVSDVVALRQDQFRSMPNLNDEGANHHPRFQLPREVPQ